MPRAAAVHRLAGVLAFAGICGAVAMMLNAGPLQAQATPPSETFQSRIENAARALGNEPRLKNLPFEKRLALTEFVVGNMLFVVVHEIGHAAVSELDLPVLGREEDAADSFAIVAALHIGTEFSQRVLVESAKGWFLTDRRASKEGEALAFYGEHGLDKQRAYQIVCLMVGSDPVKFRDLAEEKKLPDDRQGSCRRDYRVASRSWEAVLAPHRHVEGQPKTRIDVIYGEGTGQLDVYARMFRDIRFLETIADRVSENLDWKGPLALEMRSCGEVNAYWYKKDRKVHICYEMAQEFAELYRDFGPDRKYFKRRRK